MVDSILIPIASIVASIIVAYYTATYAVKRERTHGQARLLEICRRHVMNVFNAYDYKGGGPTAIKGGRKTYDLYIAELEHIVSDLDDLLGNVFVEELILQHGGVTRTLLLLRRELMRLQLSNDTSLNSSNFPDFVAIGDIFDLYHVVRDKLGKRSAEHIIDDEMEKVEEVFRQFDASERSRVSPRPTPSSQA